MYSEQIEKDVIIACLHDESFVADVYQILSPNHFTRPVFKWAYKIVKEHFRRYSELPNRTVFKNELVKSKLEPKKKVLFEKIVFDLIKSSPKAKNYSKDQVLEYVSDISFIQALEKVAEEVESGNVGKARKLIFNQVLSMDKMKGYIIGNWLKEFENRQSERKNRKLNPSQNFMIQSPYSKLNKIVDGIQSGEVASVTAVTSAGKSIMLHDWGANALIEGIEVAHFTIENTKWQTDQRYDSRVLGVPYDSFKRYEFTQKQTSQIERNIAALRKMIGEKLMVVKSPQNGTDVIMLEQALRELELRGFYAKFIILDYADIMEPVKKYESFRLGQSGVYWDVKAWAVDRNLPLLTATQAQAKYNVPDKRGRILIPTAEAASESYWKGRILDIMFTLYQTTKQKFQAITTCHLAKNRDGPRGFEVFLKEDFANMRFLEL